MQYGIFTSYPGPCYEPDVLDEGAWGFLDQEEQYPEAQGGAWSFTFENGLVLSGEGA